MNTTSEQERIQIRHSDGVLTLQLNRPAQKNALSLAMYQTLAEALEAAATDKAVRVVHIVGSEDSFTAGNDLADFLQAPELTADHPARRFMSAVMALPQPLVAEVNGLAVGIGTTLLLHCDFVYASDEASFAVPFVKLGLCPEFASSRLLTQRVGPALSRRMLMLGETIDATGAERAGLVTALYPPAQLAGAVAGLCQTLTRLPPQALARTKALMRAGEQTDLEGVIERELAEFSQCLTGDECRAALAAMQQKE